jgi:hypothetical protein
MMGRYQGIPAGQSQWIPPEQYGGGRPAAAPATNAGTPEGASGALDLSMAGMILQQLVRIANALEAQRDAGLDDLQSFPLADWAGFDWPAHGYAVATTDADGVASIRTPRGRLAYRRGNAKFGADIWYSHGNGRGPDGDPQYHRVCEFKAAKETEPLDRRTAAAAGHAAAQKPATQTAGAPAAGQAAAQKPAAVHPLVAELIRQQDATLAQLGAAGCLEKAPALVLPSMDPPTANAALAKLLGSAGDWLRAHRTEDQATAEAELMDALKKAYALGLTVDVTDGAPHNRAPFLIRQSTERVLALVAAAEAGARDKALDAARMWLAGHPRISADTVEGFKQIVQATGYQYAAADTSWNARADSYRAWLVEQAKPVAA